MKIFLFSFSSKVKNKIKFASKKKNKKKNLHSPLTNMLSYKNDYHIENQLMKIN